MPELPPFQTVKFVLIEDNPVVYGVPDPEHEGHEIAVLRDLWKAMPLRFYTALRHLAEAEPDAATCQRCDALVGWVIHTVEDAHGAEHTAILWRPASLITDDQTGAPILIQCGDCTPRVPRTVDRPEVSHA